MKALRTVAACLVILFGLAYFSERAGWVELPGTSGVYLALQIVLLAFVSFTFTGRQAGAEDLTHG